jgi:PAS domain S-box-containing protein/putative nucleotidyltransferase with HDIG domain
MSLPLRVLILKDRPSDVELILHELRHAGFEPAWQRVESEADYLSALDPKLDLILADHRLAQFDGMDALQLLKQRGLDIPFILVSGTIGEEAVVEAMRQGAADYLIKDRLPRLGPAVTRALEEKRLRSEKQRIHEELRLSERRLANVLDHAAEAIIALNNSYRIIVFNRAAERMFGYRTDEILGQPLDLLLPERFAEGHRQHARNFAAATETARSISHREELCARRKDGSEFPVEIGLSKLSEGGDVIFTAMVVDTSARQRAEQALRESEKRFRALIESSSDGIALTDADGKILYDSPAITPILGYAPGERLGRSVFEFTHPDERQTSMERFARLAQQLGAVVKSQGRFRHKDGSWRWIEGVRSNLLHQPGVQAIVVNYRDVTERVRAQQRLTAQYTVSRHLAESGTLAEASPKILQALCECLEWDQGEAWGVLWSADLQANALHFTGTWYPSSLTFPEFEAVTRQIEFAPGVGLPGRVWASGEPAWIPDVTQDVNFLRAPIAAKEGLRAGFAFPLKTDGGVLGVIGFFSREIRQPDNDLLQMFTSISNQISQFIKRKQSEEALKESEKYFRSLIENASDVITVLDGAGTILYESASLERVLGYKPEELLGRNAFELVHPDDLAGIVEAFARGFQSLASTQLVEARIRHKDDSWRVVEMIGKPAPDRTGQMIGIVNSRDITDRKRAEEEQARLTAILQSTTDLVATADLRGFVQDINRAGREMLGLSEDQDVTSTRIADYHTEAAAAVVMHEGIPAAMESGYWSGETALVSRDGRVIPVSQVIIAHKGRDGSIRYLSTIARDITERKQAEEALRQSEATQRLVLSNIDEIAYSVQLTEDDPFAGIVRFVSSRVESGLGYSPHEFMENPRFWASYLHPDEITTFKAQTREIFASQRPGTREYQVRHKHTGEYHWMEDRIVPELDEAGRVVGVFGVARDVTERKQAEAAIRQQLAELKVLHAIAVLGVAVLDEDELIEKATRVIGDTLYPDEFGVLLLDEAAGSLRIHPSYRGIPDELKRDLIPLGRGVTGQVAATGQPRRIGDAAREPDFLIFEMGTRSELCVPLKVGEKVIGVIDAESARLDAYSEADERLLATLAGQLATAIERLRAQKAEGERVSELKALAQVSMALRTASTRAEMLPVILDQLLTLLKVDGALLATRDPASAETVIELGRGAAGTSLTGERLPPREGIAGYVIATGQPYLSNTVLSDPHLARPDLLLRGIGAVACVPLIVQAQTVGALCVLSAKETGADEARLLAAVADIAANAIHRATLHEQTERRLQHVTALSAINRAITSIFSLDVSLTTLIRQATVQLGVDAASVFLFDSSLQTLDLVREYGFRTRAVGHVQLRLGEGYAGRAALERQTVHIPNLMEEHDNPRMARALAGEGFISFYAVPLIAKGQLKGVLAVLHRSLLIPDEEWLDFLDSLAWQAAIAINSAQLFENLQHSNLDLALAYDATIEGWSRAMDLRDKETEGHTQRVTETTERLARVMGMSGAEMVHIRRGALLHDIGKMGVPDSILLKPGSLTDEEWVVMRRHPQFAYDMLLPIRYLHPALDIPYCHHEKWDGTGYPRSLKGEQIPLAARLFAVVDVWDALRSDRPYRPAWPEDKARAYITEQAGKHFDPKVVDAFLTLTATNLSDTNDA